MPEFFAIIWDDESDADGNIQHIAEHGLTIDDVEYVLMNPTQEGVSRSSGRPCCLGYTESGDYIIVIYEQYDDDMLYPVTAYDVEE